MSDHMHACAAALRKAGALPCRLYFLGVRSFSPTILVCVQCESGNCTVRCAQLNPAACLFVIDFLSSLEHNDCTAPPVPCVAVARLVSSILTKPLRIDRVASIFGIRLWVRIQKLPQDTVTRTLMVL